MPTLPPNGRAAFAVIIGLALFAAALYWLPKVQTAGMQAQLVKQQKMNPTSTSPAPISQIDVFNAEDKARGTLATIFAGLLLLVGAYFTWRTTKATEDKQITERFTSAVTNLSADGPDKMALRLGGIYALERIDHDSPDDQWTVMEVLTAYVRDKRIISKHLDSSVRTKSAEVGEDYHKNQTQHDGIERLPTDIQAILTVIGRRDQQHDESMILDLSRTDLGGADMSGGNFRHASFAGADLRYSYIVKTKLQYAILYKANLQGAIMRNADLEHAILQHANLQNAELVGAKNLAQEQLDIVNPDHSPKTLPLGLYAPTSPAPDLLP